MKKRNCRMSTEEKAIHEFAVKVRKMTDKQIYDFVNDTSSDNNISKFINQITEKGISGVGPATIKK